MKICNSSEKWAERKRMFQTKRLLVLISIKESYERKLASISASIVKLQEQMEKSDENTDI